MKLKLLLILSITCISIASIAQNVGIGTNNPSTGAKLDIQASDNGILIPRVALVATNDTAPIVGVLDTSLLVYNTTTNSLVKPGFYYWDGRIWDRILVSRDSASVDNGLEFTIPGFKTQLGGNLIKNTTITQGDNDMIFNLNSNGDFIIQDDGINHFEIRSSGNSVFGGDSYWQDESTNGSVLATLTDFGDDGVFQVFRNGNPQHIINGGAITVFNEQGFDYDFRIESNDNANMFSLDAGNDRVGIATALPSHTLHVVNDATTTSSTVVSMLNFADNGDTQTSSVVIPSDAVSVTVTIEAAGDLDLSSEYFTVFFNGNQIGGNLNTGFQDCTYHSVISNQNVSSSALPFSGGSMPISVTSSVATNINTLCTATAIQLRMSFTFTTPTPTARFENGTIRVDDLGGSGTQMVTADANGDLGIQALPDLSSTNELQDLSSASSGTNRTINISGGAGTTISVADNDNDSSNELQNLSISGSTITLNNGGGNVTVPSSADNLGNHNATTTLELNSNQITGVSKLIPLGTSDYDKLRVYNSPNYTIGMHSAMSFGALNDWAMTFTMNQDDERGWVWRDVDDAETDGAMSLTTNGRLTLKSSAVFNEAAVFNETSGNFDFRVESNANENMLFVDASTDRVGIGTSTPTGFLDLRPGNQNFGFYSNHDKTTSSSAYGIYIDLDNTYTAAATTYGARIDAYKNGASNSSTYGAYLLGRDYQTGTGTRTTYGVYGYTYVSSTLGTSNSRGIFGIASGNGSNEFAGYFSGDVYSTGAYLPSDRKLKSNIKDYNGALAKLTTLGVKTYDFKTSEYPMLNLPEGEQIGLISQEVQEIFPNMVKRADETVQLIPLEDAIDMKIEYRESEEEGMVEVGKDVEILAIDYTKLVPVLIEATKEQQEIINILQEQLDLQQKQINELLLVK